MKHYFFDRNNNPEWSGIAKGASHPHANSRRDVMHTLERQADQLAMAGITAVPLPDLSWAQGDIARFSLMAPIVLLVPGGAAHRPEKRWPAGRYAQLAALIAKGGATPVVIGGPDERGDRARHEYDASGNGEDVYNDASSLTLRG